MCILSRLAMYMCRSLQTNRLHILLHICHRLRKFGRHIRAVCHLSNRLYVFTTIWPCHCTFSIPVVILPIALIPLSVWPCYNTVAVLQSIFPLTYIFDAIFPRINAFPIPQSVSILSLIYVSIKFTAVTSNPFSSTVAFIVSPSTFVNISIIINVPPSTVSHTIPIISFIY